MMTVFELFALLKPAPWRRPSSRQVTETVRLARVLFAFDGGGSPADTLEALVREGYRRGNRGPGGADHLAWPRLERSVRRFRIDSALAAFTAGFALGRADAGELTLAEAENVTEVIGRRTPEPEEDVFDPRQELIAWLTRTDPESGRPEDPRAAQPSGQRIDQRASWSAA